MDFVIAGAAVDQVVIFVAEDQVVAIFAEDCVPAETTMDIVATSTAKYEVGAIGGFDEVVASEPVDGVGVVGGEKLVVSFRPDYGSHHSDKSVPVKIGIAFFLLAQDVERPNSGRVPPHVTALNEWLA